MSRSRIFQLKLAECGEHSKLLYRAVSDKERGLGNMALQLNEDAAEFLARLSDGDARAALGALELGALTTPPGEDGRIVIDLETASQCIQRKAFRFDKDGDAHYDILSCFQKSIRGSDPDAAIHYLARLIEGGDLKSICRRLLVIASEDVGLGLPQRDQYREELYRRGITGRTAGSTAESGTGSDSPGHGSQIQFRDKGDRRGFGGFADTGTGGDPAHLRDAHYAERRNWGMEWNICTRTIIRIIMSSSNICQTHWKVPSIISRGENKNERAPSASI